MGEWAKRYPDAVKMMAEQGHDVSNHSQNHFKMSALGKDKIRSEITECNRTLEALSGKKVELFRAPYGDYTKDTVSIAEQSGCYTIQWDVDSLDWKPGISKEEICSRILSKTKKGSILLFHNDTPHTADLLPRIIKDLKSKGFEIVPVSQLIFRDNYEIRFDGMQIRSQE